MIATAIGYFYLEHMLRNNFPKQKMFLINLVPGIFLTIGMEMMLSGMPSSKEYLIPLKLYFLCGIFWMVLWAIFLFSMIMTHSLRPKESPLMEWVRQKLKARK
jgi:predicted tellurium resistance membrane protein TerC